jgi:hypothetical protein
MLGSALYYPYIDIHDPLWLRSAVLFWDEIKTIAPRAVSTPYQNEETRVLWQEGFLEPLRCDLYPELLDTLGKRVVGLMDSGFFRRDLNSEGLQLDPNAGVLKHADKVGESIRDQFRYARLHREKLSPEMASFAMRSGLAHMDREKLSPELRKFVRELQFYRMRSLAMRSDLAHMHRDKLSPELREFFDELRFYGMRPEEISPHLQHIMRHAELKHHNMDGQWLLFDSQFAEVYMSALAALLSKETDLAALTNEEPSMGINLHVMLDDVKPSTQSDKKGALVSLVMEAIKVDPKTRIDKLLAFRRSRENQLADLSAQFEDLSSKITTCDTSKELEERARDAYVTRIRPKLEALRSELKDSSIQSVWEGVQRAVTVSVPAGGALAYFSGLTGTTLLAAGAAIAVTDVAVKTHLARNKARRASPYTYLLDVERQFSISRY